MFGLFGNTKVIDKISSGIDAMVLTEQERIEYNQKRRELFLEQEREVNKQSTPRALTRRYIAVPVVYVTLMSYITVFVLAILEHPSGDHAIKAMEFMSIPFITVVCFYFGDHLISHWKGKQ